jgi:probable phosphoglycerate mutase
MDSMTITTLYLVRHGQTVWHAENRYTGSSDIALTPEGEAEAGRLADWAMAARPNAVYSSPLKRARRTAEPSAQALGLDVVEHRDLREVDFGLGEGLTRSEMRSRFPEALDAFLRAPAEHPLPEGERGLDAIARARPIVDAMVEERRGGSVLLVVHSTLLRLLLCDLLDLEPNRYRSLFPRVVNCAITTVEVGETMALTGLNVPVA